MSATRVGFVTVLNKSRGPLAGVTSFRDAADWKLLPQKNRPFSRVLCVSW
jgi:hypothetical protein